jgi:hypothetical protein
MGGSFQSLGDGLVALQAVIDLAKTTTPCKARVTRLLGRATQNADCQIGTLRARV